MLSDLRLFRFAAIAAWCCFAAAIVPVAAQVAPSHVTPEQLAKYDTNHDGVLEPDEMAVMQADLQGTAGGTVTLTPFQVDSSRDRGFAAADTYSGGRLATPLADTAAPYQVLNQEMIQALGLHELRDALDWSTNSFLGLDGSGGGYLFNLPVLNTTRGGGAPDTFRQANFFQYFSPGDSFDVERYDIGRGPNSVLFGLGGLQATSITLFKMARTDHAFQSVDVLTGSWDKYRASIDVNQPLIGQKLAIRLNGVYDTQNGWRQEDFKTNRAGYAGITYKPFKNTEIRSSVERGQQDVLQSFYTLNDNFAGWDGKTVFNVVPNSVTPTGQTSAGGTTLTNGGNDQGVQRLASNYFLYDRLSGANAIMSYTNAFTTLGAGATATTPIYTANSPTGYYTYNNAGNVSFASSGQPIIGSYDLFNDRFSNAVAHSKFRLPSQQVDNAQKVPNLKQFYNYLDLSIEQREGDFFFQLAGNVNHSININHNVQSGAQNIFIDINQVLPNGAPDPHYLQPYGDSSYQYGYHSRNNDSVRLAAAYSHDFGKWGAYQVNAVVSDNETYSSNRGRILSVEQNGDQRQWGNTDGLRTRTYLYDDRSYAPPSGPIGYVNPLTGVNTTITPQWVTQAFGTSPSDSVQHDAFGLLALNAKLLHGRAVFQLGVRDDITSVYTRSAMNEGQYPSNWNGSQIIWRPDAPPDWTTLMYVPKDANGNATGPATHAVSRPTANNAFGVPIPLAQYAGDRFQDDYNAPKLNTSKGITKSLATVLHITQGISFIGDISSTFTPNSVTTPQIDNTNLPNIQAHGFDLGARYAVPGGVFLISYNHYWNYSTGNHTVPNTLSSPLISLLSYRPTGATSGNNALNIPVPIGGLNDTTDQFAVGDEIEVTANPARGWRMTGSLSFPFLYNLNADPLLLGYIKGHQQDLITILQQDGGSLDTTQQPNGAPGFAVVNPNVSSTTALDQTAAVNAYNNIYAAKGSIVAGKQLIARAPVLNFFTDYTFQHGIVKGLDLGIGVQYRGRNIVDYTVGNTIPNPANPATAIVAPNASPYTPITVSGYTRTTGTIGYHFAYWGSRSMFVNLRIQNLLNQREIIYNSPGTHLAPYNGDYTSAARTKYPNIFGEFRAPMNFTLEASTTF